MDRRWQLDELHVSIFGEWYLSGALADRMQLLSMKQIKQISLKWFKMM